MLHKWLGALIALVALTLVACAANSTAPLPQGTPPPPSPGPLTLVSSTQNVAVTSTGGASGVVAVPGGTGTVDIAVSASAPTGTTTLQSTARSAASVGTLQTGGDTALVYVAITASSTATLDGVPGFTLTLSAAPTESVYEALWNGAQWITVGSAGTVSGTTVKLAGSTTTETVTANSPLYVVAYEGVSLAGVESNVIVDGGFETEGAAGAFAGATNGWQLCSYAHVNLGSSAAAPTPVPSIAANKVTADLISASSTSFTVGATPKPGSTSTPAPVVTPGVHSGSYAALTYTGTGADTSYVKSSTGANGICQTFVVPVGGSLSLYLDEGGNESLPYGDQEATLFVGGVSALASPSPIPVFSELHATVPTASSSPAAYVVRGPYDLVDAAPKGLGIAAGTTVTLFLGTFDDDPSNTYGEYMFVDDVSVMGYLPLTSTSAASRAARAP